MADPIDPALICAYSIKPRPVPGCLCPFCQNLRVNPIIPPEQR